MSKKWEQAEQMTASDVGRIALPLPYHSLFLYCYCACLFYTGEIRTAGYSIIDVRK